MHALHCILDLFPRHQAHRYMNPADHQHALLRFHLSSHIRGQFAVARIDLARFQRTSESAHHSTSGCGNDIVEQYGEVPAGVRYVTSKHKRHHSWIPLSKTQSPYEAVEASQIESNVGEFVEEQKDADADKHDTSKALDPKQVSA